MWGTRLFSSYEKSHDGGTRGPHLLAMHGWFLQGGFPQVRSVYSFINPLTSSVYHQQKPE